jgi:hypothetical protein
LGQNSPILVTLKEAAKMWPTSAIFKIPAQNKQSFIGKFAQSGVDVKIPIFGDFPQFSAKILAFS